MTTGAWWPARAPARPSTPRDIAAPGALAARTPASPRPTQGSSRPRAQGHTRMLMMIPLALQLAPGAAIWSLSVLTISVLSLLLLLLSSIVVPQC